MNRIALVGVGVLAVMMVAECQAGIFTLDDFETGEFAVGGAQSF
jgi:hypothetical protein